MNMEQVARLEVIFQTKLGVTGQVLLHVHKTTGWIFARGVPNIITVLDDCGKYKVNSCFL
jgi:hypothetical protein